MPGVHSNKISPFIFVGAGQRHAPKCAYGVGVAGICVSVGVRSPVPLLTSIAT
jgi:hypothetical protein